mmetsp:Transcript_27767/g.90356  ORF Transcript_27767/g.90356 Transcript_27767/m.90356 type:complete len:87 (-) Transcript_27767:58-318(-)
MFVIFFVGKSFFFPKSGGGAIPFTRACAFGGRLRVSINPPHIETKSALVNVVRSFILKLCCTPLSQHDRLVLCILAGAGEKPKESA